MKIPVLFFGVFLITASPCFSQAEDILNVGGFTGAGAVGEVAERKGFLEAEGITVKFNRVRSSPELMRKFISGKYDIIQTNADNIIAWAEGQGVDPETNEFIIFMGGYRGLARDFVVAPDISSFADLHGKVLAVDAVNTGYTGVLVYMLRENGLTVNKDYTLKAVGGGSLRTNSMKQGDTVGGFVRLSDELEQMGFRKLAQSQDYVTDYARGVAAARREWADQNQALLIRYIRAMVRATYWLLDPQNKEEAVTILASATERSLADAERAYERAVDPNFGFIPGGRIERSGINQIIRLREVMGAMAPPLPSPDKYIDEGYYQDAIVSLSGQANERAILADDLQRSAKQFTFQLSARSGASRGEEIYYFKCWICHNQYTVKAGTPAPLLKDLYQRPTLINGSPVTDENVAAKIRDGGPGMPAYRHTLNDADIADLVSYFREGKCCFEGQEPPPNPWYREIAEPSAEFQVKNNLYGGPTGTVQESTGDSLEGIMVQLVWQETSIRTTVYSDEAGHYEFPRLPTGTYTLRIARPLAFKPYRRESIQINGANQLDEIILERVSDAELLPVTLNIDGQLTGAEWLMNLSGTNEVKRMFVKTCNWCHAYQLVFRTRYDEDGWRKVIDRMTHYGGSLLVNRRSAGRLPPEEEEMLVKWLTEIRGPESANPPVKPFPGAIGPATRVIVTEYELPRLWLATHDVAGDSTGNLWYSPHRSPYIGKVNPQTGFVEEHRIPDTPGAHPGTHWLTVTKDDVVWSSQNWAHKLTRLDSETGEFHQITPPPRTEEDGSPRSVNTPMGGNWVVAPDGYIWKARENMVVKVDPETGQYVETYPIKNVRGTYGSAISWDGKYFAGGSWPNDWVILLDIEEKGEVVETRARTRHQGPGRGFFDPFGNAWFGGKGGALVRIDPRTNRVKEFFAPIPYASFYEANADKNGEIWASGVQTGRYFRLDPKTEKWITYVLPEPYSHNRKSWIDNSTDPVSLWYVDHNSYLVHIQPRE